MPKIYWKTIFASFLLGLDLALLMRGLIDAKFGTWLALTLGSFIVINEKLTVREKWKIRHMLLFLAVSALWSLLLLSI